MNTLEENLDRVIRNIEKARLSVSGHHIVKLVAVGKYTDIENIKTLYELGQRAFGENQVQQLEIRVKELSELPIEWHMIGTLQKNKINKLIKLNPFLIHSIDSLELALALNKKLQSSNVKLSGLLQINSSQEATKSGVETERAIDIYQAIQAQCKNLNLQGVMSIGANSDDRSEVQRNFKTTYTVFEKLKKNGANICSMGMSGDYELAIQCGSNLVRVGSKIFR
ncbi:MAG: YggS family pyridoxal phosphate-dependent enzyme [Campylobacterales bacterium]|nr:YggS family pyridoxal phosphate-dependent enzyme [Campylobacterales bacterium]